MAALATNAGIGLNLRSGFFEGALFRRGHVAGNNIRRDARYTRRRDACATSRSVQAVDRRNRILEFTRKPKLAASERKEHNARRADGGGAHP